MQAGWHAVSQEPMTARQFNEYWVSLERYNLLQSKEGREQLQTRVAARFAIDLDKKALSGEYGTDAMQAIPPQVIADPATARTPWTDAHAMLALLPPDDPRSAFLRAGGRLNANGDPMVRTPRTAKTPKSSKTP